MELSELQVDVEGYVRFTEPVKMTESELNEFIEWAYVKGHINLKKKKLDKTFAEYDRKMGGVKGPMRHWLPSERKHVLETVGEETDAVGEELGRSGMSIYMERAKLLARFEAYSMKEENVGKSRDELVNAFISETYGNDEE
jgi:hypothetical protein